MGKTAPKGYLACDGKEYNIADYEKLANFIKEQFGTVNNFGGDGVTMFAVPNLQGEFLRGTGVNSHNIQGAGAEVGEHQNATEIPHFQIDNINICISGSVKNSDGTDSNTGASSGNVSKYKWTTPYNHLVRPTNTSVLYCIKY